MAKVIMVQGTMSNVGKSFLVAGLCRIFREEGYSVAPFKSQNMVLNSYITADGLEMGRAQVMQAEAAGVKPEIWMNPILLKPNSHMGSQLIVNGIVRGNYPAAEYFKMKKSLVPDVMRAYETLASRYDVIVVEGAGSPAEINLRENDLVNMGLAERIHAPVLLVGDIDRGGVFAQLYGTAALLEESERKRIKAFIINKFRGDKEILKPGLSMLYDRIPIPTAGVVPYMDVDLDDEDSLAERLSGPGGRKSGSDTKAEAPFAKIAVVCLPRISNFTDFNVLERLPGISLSYVRKPEALGGADLIILPGTKNTMGDLKWLRQSGMEAAILKKVSEGTAVFGICGGFQMLGNRLSDPYDVEEGGQLHGMGLLPVETVFEEKKTTTRVAGTAFFQGETDISGYEIHMGTTTRQAGTPFAVIEETAGGHSIKKKEDGCRYKQVFGTYIHGVFDSDGMQKAIWRLLAEKKNVPETVYGRREAGTVDAYKESQYQKMAAILRENLDMDLIGKILNGSL